MKIFTTILFSLLLCAPSFAVIRPAKIVAEIQAAMEDEDKVLELTNTATNNLLQKAMQELEDRGEIDTAASIRYDWELVYQKSVMAGVGRAIGDHPPAWKWLADTYDKIEAKLGRQLCVDLHIADLKTLNFCIPVIFHMCSFDMGSVAGSRRDEVRRHFATDGVYHGLAPVVSYWVIFGVCEAGGGNIMCGVLATVGEKIMEAFVAPRMSDFIFDKKCGVRGR